ncbi:hypothetical protein ACIHFD_49690 [Nonomuraea sp. NPDC051941]|uniref:hypothetical protein n=1 Tax=Nonomuraea sp. NPDC051941 TaxID=3364373 RepID=UPI0037C92245
MSTLTFDPAKFGILFNFPLASDSSRVINVMPGDRETSNGKITAWRVACDRKYLTTEGDWVPVAADSRKQDAAELIGFTDRDAALQAAYDAAEML